MLRGRVVGVCLVALSIAALCAGTVLAQPQRGQQRGGQGGGQPQRGGGFGGAMQGPGGMMQGPGGMFGGAGMGMMAELTLVRRADVQDELGLTEDQVEELTQLRPNIDMRAIMGEMRDLDEQQRADRVRELMESGQKEMQEQIDTILLPKQASRLKQLAVQWQLRGGGGLTNREISDKIGISDDQRDKLREKARQLEQELRKKLQDELLKELTPQQQAKVKELMGEPFEFQQEEPRGPQRGGAAPAGGAAAGRRNRGN